MELIERVLKQYEEDNAEEFDYEDEDEEEDIAKIMMKTISKMMKTTKTSTTLLETEKGRQKENGRNVRRDQNLAFYCFVKSNNCQISS